MAESRGLPFVPLQGDPDRLAAAFADRAGANGPRMVARMMEHVLPLAAPVFQACREATRDAEFIVHSFLLTEAGHTLACLRGVPDVSAQLFPVFTATSRFAAPTFPDLPLGGVYRRATHVLNTWVFRFGGRLMYRRVRRAHTDLPVLAPWPWTAAGMRTPMVYAFSPSVLPPPPDWPPDVLVSGYWNLAPPRGWTAPDPLLRFLDSGPPPIYFGVGSMRTHRLSDLIHWAIDAARETGQRVLLGVPPGALEGFDAGGDVLGVDGVPHDWLFPRTSLVIHHGGAGTTGAAARAGVPSMAAPFSADQVFWARRIHRLGVGPASPMALRLTTERLASLIEQALSNPSYRIQARDLGAAIRREDGVGSAVRWLEGWLATGKPFVGDGLGDESGA